MHTVPISGDKQSLPRPFLRLSDNFSDKCVDTYLLWHFNVASTLGTANTAVCEYLRVCISLDV